MIRTLTLALLTFLPVAALAQNGDWKLEALHTKAGKSYPGLVLEETPAEVRFQIVRRAPGRATAAFTIAVPRADVKRIDKLAAKDREELTARLAGLDALKSLELKPQPFVVGTRRKEGLSYATDHFELISDASDDVVRRAALRLEQLDAALTYFLPPVSRAQRPNTTTTVLLYQSLDEYHNILKGQGRDIFNPAWYDASGNVIIAAADLAPVVKEMGEARRANDELLERIKKQEAEVKKLPKGEVQDRAREQLQEARREVARANARNEELFQRAARMLMRSVQHEAFHAYLVNFVFPASRGEVPRWLNEGLAQIFEEAIDDAGVLNVGRVEPARLEKARAVELVPLADLLKANGAPFVVGHGQDRQLADRYYLTSWALAHYLMFNSRVVGTPAFDDYLTALNGMIDPKTDMRQRGADPVEALTKLTGQPLPALEKELRQYVKTLPAEPGK